MNRDDIRRWAKQACGTQWSIFKDFEDFMPELERFAELVAAAEREECARVCEIQDDDYEEPECAWVKCARCANEIRSRG